MYAAAASWLLRLGAPRPVLSLVASSCGEKGSADRGFHRAFAADLMEPARPQADEIVLQILETRVLRRGDLVETRDGRCRLGAPLARALVRHSRPLGDTILPHAKRVASELLRTTQVGRATNEAAAAATG